MVMVVAVQVGGEFSSFVGVVGCSLGSAWLGGRDMGVRHRQSGKRRTAEPKPGLHQ